MSRTRALAAFVAAALIVSTVVTAGAPSAGAAPALADKLGVYRGSANPDGVAAFESWLGRPTPWVLDYLASDTWADIENPEWWADGWAGSKYRVVWSVPLLPKTGGSLREGASGAYNVHFRRLAERLVANGQANAVIRPGWEFNGEWFSWAAKGDPGGFVAYWRHVVTTMRGVPGAQFRFDWSPSAGSSFPLEQAYPGDAYVDYIGLDSYDHGWGAGWQDPVRRWQHALTEPYGLLWHRNFAAAHGKPMTYPEWGLFIRSDGHGGGDNPYYLERMYDWLTTNNVAYALYFEFDAHDGEHSLLAGHFPRATERFRALFGPSAPAAPTPPSPRPAPAPAPPPPPVKELPVTPPPVAPNPKGRGYRLVGADGRVFSFGVFRAAQTPPRLRHPAVGMATTPSGGGHWLVAAHGGVFASGDARDLGSTTHLHLRRPIVGMAATPTGNGYWLVASDGGVFSFGDARFFGSTGGIRLAQPIVGMAATPGGGGYWMAARDGGIFSFGDAPFLGSAAPHRPSSPVVGMSALR